MPARISHDNKIAIEFHGTEFRLPPERIYDFLSEAKASEEKVVIWAPGVCAQENGLPLYARLLEVELINLQEFFALSRGETGSPGDKALQGLEEEAPAPVEELPNPYEKVVGWEMMS